MRRIVSGEVILLPGHLKPLRVSYCAATDSIAVSVYFRPEILIWCYRDMGFRSTINLKRAEHVHGIRGDGVAFIHGGAKLLVAVSATNSVDVYCVSSGAFISHFATTSSHGITCPEFLSMHPDTGLVAVACSSPAPTPLNPYIVERSMWLLGETSSEKCFLLSPKMMLCITGVAYLQDKLVVKEVGGDVHTVTITDVFKSSLRFSWLHACKLLENA